MKWRNQLLALFCLFVFLGFGVLYFRYWVIQKPFGIILFISEGLDSQTLAAMRLHAGGADKSLAIDSLTHTALLRNYSADSPVPDPAAAATAIATGTKVDNGVVAVNAKSEALTALLALARDAGRATGLITDGELTAPTAASFYGHAPRKDQWEEFARQLVELSEIDVILGRGAADFLPTSQGGRRSDEKDLVKTARDAGYDYVGSLAELDEVPRWRRAMVMGLFDGPTTEKPNETKNPKPQPPLSALVRRGIELLQFHRGGYLLVIDASLMRRAGKSGDGEGRLDEAAEFDHAVAVAKEYTGEKSVIFVCSDVADGRPRGKIMEEPARLAISPRVWIPDSEDVYTPAVDYARSSPAKSEVDALTSSLGSPEPASEETGLPQDVPAFGKGLGADALRGTQDNTAVFEIIRDNL